MWACLVFMMAVSPQDQSSLRPVGLTTERIDSPLGLDNPRPRLSWRSEATVRGQRGLYQSAYQVQVASRAELLHRGTPDLWDTGKVAGSQSLDILYGGRALRSNQEVWWRVLVWDQADRRSQPSHPVRFTTGLLSREDWRAQWIGASIPEVELFFEEAQWVWHPTASLEAAPPGRVLLRRVIELDEEQAQGPARVAITVDDRFILTVNGQQVSASHPSAADAWRIPQRIDLTGKLRPGSNEFIVEAENLAGPAGLLFGLRVGTGAAATGWVSDGRWMARREEETEWAPVAVLAEHGSAPWGHLDAHRLDPRPAPHLRKPFRVSAKPMRATAFIIGLGYHQLWLNGQRVGDRVLEPSFSRFDLREKVSTYDLTGLVTEGANTVGLVLGSGFLNVSAPDAWDFHRAPWRGQPRALVQIHIETADGRTHLVTSGEDWRYAYGPWRFDQIRQGASYDARHKLGDWSSPGFDASAWSPVVVLPDTQAVRSAFVAPPCRVVETIQPVTVTRLDANTHVVDLGQNIAGWARIRPRGERGTTIRLRFAERLHPDGSLDTRNIASLVFHPRFQQDEYTLSGTDGEEWEPEFVYHGFQYIEVTGWPGELSRYDIDGRVVQTDFGSAGSFVSSHWLLNDIQRLTLWAYRGNFVGIPTDCPHREKNGWTGDAHLAAEQAMFNWNNLPAYEKWMADVRDSQRADGSVACIVPTGTWGYEWGTGPAWDSALFIIPWTLYQYSGSTKALEDSYQAMKRWLEFCKSRSPGYIANWGLGDWCHPKEATPEAVTSTAYFYICARITADTARLLNKPEEASQFDTLAGRIREAFVREFVREDGTVANGTQTAQSAALFQGMVEGPLADKVFARLVERVEQDGVLMNFGILGSKYVFHTLSERGRHDLAVRMAKATGFPSYGEWVLRGATTLWEDFPGGQSLNHIMFGDISAWFYRELAGIRPDDLVPGFHRFTLKPRVAEGLEWVQAHHDSPYGRIASSWHSVEGVFQWEIAIPPNTQAEVWVPWDGHSQVTEGEGVNVRAGDFEVLGYAPGYLRLRLGSGSYRLRSQV